MRCPPAHSSSPSRDLFLLLTGTSSKGDGQRRSQIAVLRDTGQLYGGTQTFVSRIRTRFSACSVKVVVAKPLICRRFKPAAANVLPQQGRFDTFVDRYNRERPHQALGMRVPADVYTP
jgi:hypothetical protein